MFSLILALALSVILTEERSPQFQLRQDKVTTLSHVNGNARGDVHVARCLIIRGRATRGNGGVLTGRVYIAQRVVQCVRVHVPALRVAGVEGQSGADEEIAPRVVEI